MVTIYQNDQVVAVKMIWKCKTGNKVWYTADRALFESLPVGQQVSRYAYVLHKDPVVSPIYGTTRQDRTHEETDYICQDEPMGRMYLNGPASKRVARIWKASAVGANPMIAASGVKPIILDEGFVGSSLGSSRTVGAKPQILGYGWLIDSPDRFGESVAYDLVGPTTTHSIKFALGAGGCPTSWTVTNAARSWACQMINTYNSFGRSLQVAPFGRNDDPSNHSSQLNPANHGSYYDDGNKMPWHPDPPAPVINDRTIHGAPVISFDPPKPHPEGGWICTIVTPGTEWAVDEHTPNFDPPTENAGGFDRPLIWLGIRIKLELWINYKGRENLHRMTASFEIDRPLTSPYFWDGTLVETWKCQAPYFGLRYGTVHNDGIFSFDPALPLRTDLTAIVNVVPDSGTIDFRLTNSGTYRNQILIGALPTPSFSSCLYVRSTTATANDLCVGIASRLGAHNNRKEISEIQMLATRLAADGADPPREAWSTMTLCALQAGYHHSGGSFVGHPIRPWAPTPEPPLWGPITSFWMTDTQTNLEAHATWLYQQGLI